jgi:hypothetical protein
MKGRTIFTLKASVYSTNLVTVVVSASMTLSGTLHPGAEPWISERRARPRLSAAGFAGESGVEVLPIMDTTRPQAPATATWSYRLTWRSVPNEPVIAALKKAGMLWFKGGSTHPLANRFRFHLKADGRHEEEARERVRAVIDKAGGDSSDLIVHHPDPERLRAMQVAAREALRTAAAADPPPSTR